MIPVAKGNKEKTVKREKEKTIAKRTKRKRVK